MSTTPDPEQLVAYYFAKEKIYGKRLQDRLKQHQLQLSFVELDRYMAKAIKNGLLVFRPPINEELGEKLVNHLREKHPTRPKLTVVSDESGHLDAFFFAAASILARCIDDVSSASHDSDSKQAPEKTIVAIAAGPALASTIRQLPSCGTPPHRSQLEFIALSGHLGEPDQIQHTSGYQAVRLAEIYDGSHHFPLGAMDYERLEGKVESARLVISGVGGSRDSFLLQEIDKILPGERHSEIVGDILFLPIGDDGNILSKGRIADHIAKLRKERGVCPKPEKWIAVRPNPNLRVLVIVGPTPSAQLYKDRVVELIIRNNLATDVVMPTSMARRILKSISLQTPGD